MSKAHDTKTAVKTALALLLTLLLATCAAADSGTYVDSQNGFEIVASQGWRFSDQDKLTVTSPESTERNTINLTVQVIPAGEFTAQNFAQVLKAQAEQSFGGKVVAEKTVTINGIEAQELIWETQKNAQISRNITTVVVKDGKLYMLNGRLPKGRFSEFQSHITAMMSSFEFLPAQ